MRWAVFFAYALCAAKQRRVARKDGQAQIGQRQAAQQNQRDLWPDARNGYQVAEHVALLMGGKAVQVKRILAHAQVGKQAAAVLCGGQRGQRVHAYQQPETHAASH